jgi:hypothetical protein
LGRPRTQRADRDGLRSVQRAAGVLRLFSLEVPVLTLRDVARSLEIPRSTAHRLLRSMEDAGFLVYDPEAQAYGWVCGWSGWARWQCTRWICGPRADPTCAPWPRRQESPRSSWSFKGAPWSWWTCRRVSRRYGSASRWELRGRSMRVPATGPACVPTPWGAGGSPSQAAAAYHPPHHHGARPAAPRA